LAYLGSMCRRCRQRHRVAEVAARERAHVGQLVAAGLAPAAARCFLRTGQDDVLVAALRRVEPARPPRGPAPTGMLWPAAGGQPAEVTVALQAASRRRPLLGR
jgi:hypothetical protein